MTAAQRDHLETVAIRLLEVRDEFPDSTLAELYSPLAMPEQLVHAHDLLDRAVITVFAGRRQLALASDQLGVLFEHYEDRRSPMLAAVRTTKARRTRH
jgi:hypothetical protein